MYLCNGKGNHKTSHHVEEDNSSDQYSQVKKWCEPINHPLCICIDSCFSSIRVKEKGIAKEVKDIW